MKKRILSCLLSIAMCLTLLPLGIQAQAAYFGDVTSHWARSYIEDAVDMGLFNGTAPNRFEPESAAGTAMRLHGHRRTALLPVQALSVFLRTTALRESRW